MTINDARGVRTLVFLAGGALPKLNAGSKRHSFHPYSDSQAVLSTGLEVAHQLFLVPTPTTRLSKSPQSTGRDVTAGAYRLAIVCLTQKRPWK